MFLTTGSGSLPDLPPFCRSRNQYRFWNSGARAPRAGADRL